MPTEFEGLTDEAERQPFTGWDFSFLEGRYLEGKPSWDFAGEARSIIRSSRSMLDLGTGGGEFLASLSPLPEVCAATEGYQPNLRIARDRLRPLGVSVVSTFCDDNGVERQRGALPFREGSFDFVLDRHEAFLADEVARVLRPGGIFATQQVGWDNNLELHELFARIPSVAQTRRKRWDLDAAIEEAQRAGMKLLESKEERVQSKFLDVGAVVYYLKAIPWEVPGFGVKACAKELAKLHETIGRSGAFHVTTSRFYLQAIRE